MKFLKLFKRQITRISWFSLLLLCVSSSFTVHAQTDNTPFPQATELKQGSPLTNQEFVRLLYQLSSHPEGRDDLIDEIRKRGIGFPLTAGLRSLAATKSGNDSTLLHTLDEADLVAHGLKLSHGFVVIEQANVGGREIALVQYLGNFLAFE